MSTRTRTRTSARRRAELWRRRLMLVLVMLTAGVVAYVAMRPTVDKAVVEITLPLRHEDIIRQQAREKRLDPALIAAVIYTESRFRDGQTSHAGAEGLMQVTPATAKDIARRSGGTAFQVEDLATAQVNISYGSYYLRHLLDRYGENETFALAAYNGGQGNVDRWINAARQRDEALTIDAIPFTETREYVSKVQDARAQYRRIYAEQLGL